MVNKFAFICIRYASLSDTFVFPRTMLSGSFTSPSTRRDASRHKCN